MFAGHKVIELFCLADDFCKEFALRQERCLLGGKKSGHRNKPNRMGDVGVMVILVLFHSGGSRCFKHYCKEHVCERLERFCPETSFLTSYDLPPRLKATGEAP